jgi:muramidase (phage lysozyme)
MPYTPPASDYYQRNKMATQDLTRAKQLLSEAGTPAAQLNAVASNAQARAKELAIAQNLEDNINITSFHETGKPAAEGYKIGYGNKIIANFDKKPNNNVSFTDLKGKVDGTTAEGFAQFNKATWNDMSKKTGCTSFTLECQKANYIQLLKDRGAYDMAANGDHQGVIKKMGGTFASYPTSPYPQGKKSWEQTNNIIAQVTGQQPPSQSYSGNSGGNGGGGKKPLAISEQNLLTAALTPSPEEQMATAAQNEEAAQRQRTDFLAQEQSTQDLEVQASVDGRMKDIDKMFGDAFGFDKAFKQADNLPNLYDDKLRKLIDSA